MHSKKIGTHNSSKDCDTLKFDSSLWTENFATKFDLVCDKSDLKAIPYYGWFIGMLLTTFTLQLPDFFGRWKVMFFSQGCMSQGLQSHSVSVYCTIENLIPV